MITIDCTPVRVLLDKENLANKIDLLRDTIDLLLEETAEISDTVKLVDVADLMRNLNELRRQLNEVLKAQ
ncbi:hypothetical protein [Leyella stercorea]|jgi:hypothetical protein|uniref:hypothetical protein n=1 Tax=Leyella stercorea TaxID=363265 RepID=UPI00204A1606|nr:MAG TPA: hypothetical protein [Caudoviricetes sp.]DAP61462.1 MAG TPA: hypothetical protein [Caudoviricetes sp.]